MTKYYSWIILYFITATFSLSAQDVTTIEANSEDISDNLDLEAVASVFGESKDLEDFEKRLNDPKTQISNLDLNNDGEVDYLRVMETAEGNVHTISIQSIMGKDLYQEVATIVVEKDAKGKTQVQVVGDVNMYGPNYYITPIYPVVPVFFTFFWVATYRPWYSPWYWGYRPPYFRPWPPYSPYRYRSNVHIHINVHNTYNRTNVSINNKRQVNNTKNNAYFKNNPNQSFEKRNPGVSNRSELNRNRKSTNNKKDYKSTGRPVQPKNKSNTKPSTRPSSTQPSTRPSNSQPSNKLPKNQRAKPSSRPAQSPSSRPSSRPSSTRPSAPAPSRQAPSRSSVRRTRH